MPGTAKVQDITALDDKECPNNVHPIIARRPLRLRNPNAVYSREIGAPNSKKTKEQRESSPDTPSSAPTIYTGSNSTQSGLNGPKRQRKIPDSEESQACDSSKHPVEWLDRVLETSYATRNPMSPRLCVSKATMDFLQRNRTCIFVHFPRGLGLPQPLSCYPGFRAALEDICDRFGDFYAPFAAYNAHTRVITLYTTDTAPPKHKFVDDDTAIFNLELARSAVSDPRRHLLLVVFVSENPQFFTRAMITPSKHRSTLPVNSYI
ncbi:hypothetical protein F5Y10DRAFT_233394 [Nemania abortiva]|nr:hypothetical protein F5Y10DRAFT_233394 [Nemania abortiva]